MPLLDAQTRYTVEEYLVLERTSEERHGYLDGWIYAMADESPEHGTICTNLTMLIASQLRGTSCQAWAKDAKVRSGPLLVGAGEVALVLCHVDFLPEAVEAIGEPAVGHVRGASLPGVELRHRCFPAAIECMPVDIGPAGRSDIALWRSTVGGLECPICHVACL